MSATATETAYSATEGMELQPYRAVSRAAVVSLGLGVASILGLVFPTLLILPVVGLVLGLVGLATIRRYPGEYTGGTLAAAGVGACSLLFVGGVALHTYVYLTEVPEGYARVYFHQLQPDPDYPELPVSPQSLELANQPIFIKGYMHPGVSSAGKVNHFILVNDFGTCCFGGQPKPTHMIEIHIPPGKPGVAYSRSMVKLAGQFGVSQHPGESLGLSNVWYHLKVDQVR
jgi:hypothetical protein